MYLPAFESVVPPLLRAFAPDVTVIQLGIDSHRTDPLTHLALTVQGFGSALGRVLEMSPRVVALGGGGYDLVNVARAWTAAWAALNGMTLPDALPLAVHQDLRARGLESLTLSRSARRAPRRHASLGRRSTQPNRCAASVSRSSRSTACDRST